MTPRMLGVAQSAGVVLMFLRFHTQKKGSEIAPLFLQIVNLFAISYFRRKNANPSKRPPASNVGSGIGST